MAFLDPLDIFYPPTAPMVAAPDTLSFAAAYVKFMDLELLPLVLVMLFVYGRSLATGFGDGPVVPKSRGGVLFARRLMMSICVGWLHNLILYAGYFDLYWLRGLSPETSVFAHVARIVMVTDLAWASVMHLCTGLLMDGLWFRSWAWGTAAAVGAALAYAALEVSGFHVG